MRQQWSGIFGLIFLIGAFWALPAPAQDNENRGPHQIGAFVGRVLPNGVSEDDEIFPLYGVRYSYPAGRSSYYDFLGTYGSDSKIDWQSLSVGMRMDVPIETLIGHAGLGIDVTRYEADGKDAESAVGMHFVGGVMTLIGGNVLARFDMKLNSKPGTSLAFALGIVINLDSGEAAN